MKKAFLYLLVFLVVAAIGSHLWLNSTNNYKTNGTFEITVNDKPIKINRDENGIAYVRAENKVDLTRGQGFIVAQDRLFQVEFYRAFIHGELASLLGPSMLNLDIKMRVMGITQNAARHFKLLSPETKEYLKWYCEGFNEYLRVGKDEFPMELGLLGMNPKPFTPEEIVEVVHFIGYNHAQNLEDEVLSLNLAAKMDKAAELLPLNNNPDRTQALNFALDSLSLSPQIGQLLPPPLMAEPLFPAPKMGSNNWAISGEKSTTGKPIVVNDPHVDARSLPGVFYPVGLFCPEFKAVGIAILGVPGLLSGRNEHLAFGVTNAYGDSQDLFIEKVEGDSYREGGELAPFTTRTETIKVKDGEDVNLTIRSTSRGPIISDHDVFGIGTDDVVSFRWSAADAQSTTLGFEQLLETKNVDEFRQAIAAMDVVFFNYVFGDVNGNIAHQSTGLVPKRVNYQGKVPQLAGKEDAWQGFIPKSELPNMINPERAWVGTANHDTRPNNYQHYYSEHFSPDYRYKRMKEVLSENKKFDAAAMWDLVLDCKNMQAVQLVPIFINALQEQENDINLAQILSDWDYEDKIEKVGPTVYHTLYNELMSLVLNDELPDELEESYWSNRYYWSQRMDSILLNNHPFIDNINTPEKETLSELIVEAGEKTTQKLTALFGENTEDWTWGKIHAVHFYNPIRREGSGSAYLGARVIPKNGSNETLNRGGYIKDKYETYRTEWFASFRMVADLEDNEKIRAVVAGGSAARSLHPNLTSQLNIWKEEKWIPYWLSEEKVLAHSKAELILE